MWWLMWAGVAWKPRMRAAPRPVKRRATSTTRPTKRMPQTIASWYAFASDRTLAALRSETIELCGADTFPWRGSVTTTRYARAVNGPCERSESGRLGCGSEAGGKRLCVATTHGLVKGLALVIPQPPGAGRIAGPCVVANGSRDAGVVG